MSTATATHDSLQALVVIARAAHLTRDRDLKQTTLKKLREEHGIDVRFLRNCKQEARA